jgi:hypothetical protein
LAIIGNDAYLFGGQPYSAFGGENNTIYYSALGGVSEINTYMPAWTTTWALPEPTALTLAALLTIVGIALGESRKRIN